MIVYLILFVALAIVVALPLFYKENEWLSKGCSGTCQQGRLPCDKHCTAKDRQ